MLLLSSNSRKHPVCLERVEIILSDDSSFPQDFYADIMTGRYQLNESMKQLVVLHPLRLRETIVVHRRIIAANNTGKTLQLKHAQYRCSYRLYPFNINVEHQPVPSSKTTSTLRPARMFCSNNVKLFSIAHLTNIEHRLTMVAVYGLLLCWYVCVYICILYNLKITAR